MPLPTPIDTEILRDIALRYSEGTALSVLAKSLHIRVDRLQNLLKRTKLVRHFRTRSEGRVSTLNHLAFNDLKTHEAAYWYGFLLGDGSIVKVGGTWQVSVTLKSSDVEHLHALKKFLKAPQKVSVYGPRKGRLSREGSCQLQMCSKKLGAELLRRGFSERKSLDAVIPQECRNHRSFWRGLIDADGYVGEYGYTKSPRLGLCGAQAVLLEFRRFAKAILGATHLRDLKPRFNIWYFEIDGEKAVELASLLYMGDLIALPRKKRYADAWAVGERVS